MGRTTRLFASLVSVCLWGPAGAGPAAPGPTSPRGVHLTGSGSAGPGLASAQPTPALAFASRRYGRRLAVTIGINAYRGGPFPPLRAAVADAQRMSALLGAMGFDQVDSLLDGQATREGILDLLERRLPIGTADKDLVLVFFSGHGITADGKSYIAPADATADVARSGLSLGRLKESALRMRARHVLFLMDACFSGALLKKGLTLEQTSALAYWEAAAQERVIQVLTAGAANEVALEGDGWGLFTRAVHAGLSGEADWNTDQVVTFEELARHVTRSLGLAARGQHPQHGTLEGNGTILLWDRRRLPATEDGPAGRPMIPGLEGPLRRVHDAMNRRDWATAERLLRDLLVQRSAVELNLLLAEVYLDMDALGNGSLVEGELRQAEGAAATPAEQRRLLDLRARLERARRGAP